jgi:hypothetical protein
MRAAASVALATYRAKDVRTEAKLECQGARGPLWVIIDKTHIEHNESTYPPTAALKGTSRHHRLVPEGDIRGRNKPAPASSKRGQRGSVRLERDQYQHPSFDSL